MGGKSSSTDFTLFTLQFLELLRPRPRRREANVVFPHERTYTWYISSTADFGVRVPTTVRLFLRVQRMKRRMKSVFVVHHTYCLSILVFASGVREYKQKRGNARLDLFVEQLDSAERKRAAQLAKPDGSMLGDHVADTEQVVGESDHEMKRLAFHFAIALCPS